MPVILKDSDLMEKLSSSLNLVQGKCRMHLVKSKVLVQTHKELLALIEKLQGKISEKIAVSADEIKDTARKGARSLSNQKKKLENLKKL